SSEAIDVRYKEYPHRWLGLPSQEKIVEVSGKGKLQQEEVVQHFLRDRGSAQGVREKVEEVLSRTS
ncbi:hypothetical protein LTS18_010957, partial [Coniosporium uncinatum]